MSDNAPNSFFDLAPPEKRGIGRYILGVVLTVVFSGVVIAVLSIVLARFGFQNALDLLLIQPNWVDLSPEQDGDALIICFLILASLVAMLIGTLLVAKFLHGQNLLTLLTARSKFDMNRFLKAGAVILVIQVVLVLVGYGMAPGDYRVVFDPVRMAPFVVLVLLLTPFQALAEEVFFRGYVTQGISVVTQNVAIRLLIPAILFTLFHASNGDWAAGGGWAVATYMTLALYLGFVTMRSNGLEVAAGFHTFHNILAFTLVTSEGAGMPFATVLVSKTPDYASGFLSLIPILLVHYWVIGKFGLLQDKTT